MIKARAKRTAAFSRRDLLATVMTVMFLALLTAPAIGYARSSRNAVICLMNLRELTAASHRYAADRGGLLIAAFETQAVLARGRDAWIQRTNELESEFTIRKRSPLVPYLKSTDSFLCAAAPRTTDGRRRLQLKARSYSMSHVFEDGLFLPNTLYRTYARQQEIIAPSRTYVFMDEHPESINDGGFVNIMVERLINSPRVMDYPANYHEGGAGISFADGSAQIHRWRSRSFRAPRISLLNPSTADAGVDMLWLSGHTTVRR
ncbi:MAG: hypothetical protein ACXW3Z_02070 [Limisphaerales bacterium]